jgi:hypothetical protein
MYIDELSKVACYKKSSKIDILIQTERNNSVQTSTLNLFASTCWHFYFFKYRYRPRTISKEKGCSKSSFGSIQNSYPKATIKGYSKETDNEKVVYEVESIERKKHRNISYTSDGRVVTIEESIAYAASKNMLFI